MATAPRVNRLNTRPVVKPANPIAAKTVAVGTVMKPALVNTATLVRGRTYVYKNVFFKAHIPEIVSKELADILKDLVHEVTDADNETIEKPYFDVMYDVPAPEDEKEEKIVNRLTPRRVVR